MFKLATEEDLKGAFRPKDRLTVELPSGWTFPVICRDYLAWTHPAGGRVFLVFATAGGAPTGVVFDQPSGGAGPSVAQLCDWCHQPGQGNQVGLLTARLNNQKRVGVCVCRDLSCKQKLEDAANRGGYSPLPAIEKLIAEMGRFAAEALKIDLSGAGR